MNHFYDNAGHYYFISIYLNTSNLKRKAVCKVAEYTILLVVLI